MNYYAWYFDVFIRHFKVNNEISSIYRYIVLIEHNVTIFWDIKIIFLCKLSPLTLVTHICSMSLFSFEDTLVTCVQNEPMKMHALILCIIMFKELDNNIHRGTIDVTGVAVFDKWLVKNHYRYYVNLFYFWIIQFNNWKFESWLFKTI